MARMFQMASSGLAEPIHLFVVFWSQVTEMHKYTTNTPKHRFLTVLYRRASFPGLSLSKLSARSESGPSFFKFCGRFGSGGIPKFSARSRSRVSPLKFSGRPGSGARKFSGRPSEESLAPDRGLGCRSYVFKVPAYPVHRSAAHPVPGPRCECLAAGPVPGPRCESLTPDLSLDLHFSSFAGDSGRGVILKFSA